MPDTPNIRVSAEDPFSDDAALLVKKLTAEMAALYHDTHEDGAGKFKPADVSVPRSVFLVARLEGRAVGCGALRPKGDTVAEVKRMYTEPDVRGRGVARQILAALEAHGRDFGYTSLILETGNRQPEAIRLYEKMGYERSACYDDYSEATLSVCFEKKLP